MSMTREQIATEIKSTETKLALLRSRMNATPTVNTGWHVASKQSNGSFKSKAFLGTAVSLSSTLGGKLYIPGGFSAKGKPYVIIWASLPA